MKTSKPQFLTIIGCIILIGGILFLKGPAKLLSAGIALLFLITGMAGKIMNR
jgi:hypothetical protein